MATKDKAMIREARILARLEARFAAAEQPKPPKLRHVYFAAVPALKRIKIGVSANVPERMKSLGKEWGVPFELLGQVTGGYDVERKMHRRFAHLHSISELFHDSLEIREFIAKNGEARQ